MRILCTFLFHIFCYIILLYTGFVTNYLWHTLYLFLFYIYDDVCWYSPISPCVVSFLSLYTCFFTYTIFISVSHMMPWWLLFKCFRKTGCENLPCHELFSWKAFQEFVLRLDLFYNSTSDYDFSDLRLLSWFICLLWFCHGLPNWEIVRDIFDVIG